MNLENISNSELTNRIDILRSKEREVVLKFLIHLGEFDKRKIYLSLVYSSLFDYCTRKLGYSESAAYRRVESARCLRDPPELEESFIKGEVSICTIASAAKAIKAEKTSITEIIGKSAREVQSLIAEVAPMEKPRERIKEIKVINESNNISLLPTSAVKPKEAETRYEIKFSVSKEAYEKFQKAKAKLSNKLGSDLSMESVFNELLNNFEAEAKTKLKPRNVTRINNNSRYIPISVKREISKRDNHQCSYYRMLSHGDYHKLENDIRNVFCYM